MAVLMALALSIGTLVTAQQVVLPAPTSKSLYPETKDRLTNERMSVLVAGPIKALDKGNLTLAVTRFEALLAKARAKEGPKSLTAADLEMSFGLALFNAGYMEDLEGAGDASIRHIERSVTDYAAHFGRNHPETALALTSLSDALGALNDDGMIEQRIPLIRESYAIRQSTLGDTDPETLANRVNLIVLLTHPVIKERKYFEEAVLLAAGAQRKAPAGMPAGHLLSKDRLDLAAVLPMIRLGRVDEAVIQIKRVLTDYRPSPEDPSVCVGMSKILERISAALVAMGANQQAADVSASATSMCLDAILQTKNY